MLHNDRFTYIHSSKCFGSFFPSTFCITTGCTFNKSHWACAEHALRIISCIDEGHAQHMCFALFPVFMIISTLSVVLSMEFTRSALNNTDRLMENTGCCGNSSSCYGNHCFFVVAMVALVTTLVAMGTIVFCCCHGFCGNNSSCYRNQCLILHLFFQSLSCFTNIQTNRHLSMINRN